MLLISWTFQLQAIQYNTVIISSLFNLANNKTVIMYRVTPRYVCLFLKSTHHILRSCVLLNTAISACTACTDSRLSTASSVNFCIEFCYTVIRNSVIGTSFAIKTALVYIFYISPENSVIKINYILLLTIIN